MKKRVGLYFCKQSSKYKLKVLSGLTDDEKEEFLWVLDYSKVTLAREIERCMNEA